MVNITCQSARPNYVSWLFNNSDTLPYNCWIIGENKLHIESANRHLNQGYYECHSIGENFLDALGHITVFVRGKFLFRH